MIANMQAINDSVGRILHVRVRSILRLSVAKPKIQTGHFFCFFFFASSLGEYTQGNGDVEFDFFFRLFYGEACH